MKTNKTISCEIEDIKYLAKKKFRISHVFRRFINELRQKDKENKNKGFDPESKWNLLEKINKLEKAVQAYRDLVGELDGLKKQ